ncbi:DUF1116 domain-containing protein, partial [Klebsiella pneumoniae]|uniref:oxamate carbamoyltransferase subunit AllG family protein n=1 Tax=Klebsiella pneumoniae TaxID=573 RepID=UPI001F5258CD
MPGSVGRAMAFGGVENNPNGHRTVRKFRVGLGRVLRFGANNEEVPNRLAWMRDDLAPGMKAANAQHGELELKTLMAQALHMGDEVHNRNAAATGLLIKRLLPALL